MVCDLQWNDCMSNKWCLQQLLHHKITKSSQWEHSQKKRSPEKRRIARTRDVAQLCTSHENDTLERSANNWNIWEYLTGMHFLRNSTAPQVSTMAKCIQDKQSALTSTWLPVSCSPQNELCNQLSAQAPRPFHLQHAEQHSWQPLVVAECKRRHCPYHHDALAQHTIEESVTYDDITIKQFQVQLISQVLTGFHKITQWSLVFPPTSICLTQGSWWNNSSWSILHKIHNSQRCR